MLIAGASMHLLAQFKNHAWTLANSVLIMKVSLLQMDNEKSVYDTEAWAPGIKVTVGAAWWGVVFSCL